MKTMRIPSWLEGYGTAMAVASRGSDEPLCSSDPLSALESMEIPAVCIKGYIETLYLDVSHRGTWMVAAELLSRMIAKGVPLTRLTVHRLLLVCLVLADKTINDSCLDNYSYAKIGLVSLADLNYMEKIALSHLKWDIYVTDTQAKAIEKRLRNYTELSKSQKQ
eukprot:TRINITY_DN2819_c4_g1_i1.p1 TRINITY_DN2819_c4_g1~~TRINITY_DN2819_c4_g1_i1.p1  ORF type:complete len:164 (+),score=8.90 TRINITY_DN2819_c4_g1_i1:62-553(+)